MIFEFKRFVQLQLWGKVKNDVMLYSLNTILKECGAQIETEH